MFQVKCLVNFFFLIQKTGKREKLNKGKKVRIYLFIQSVFENEEANDFLSDYYSQIFPI